MGLWLGSEFLCLCSFPTKREELTVVLFEIMSERKSGFVLRVPFFVCECLCETHSE